MSLATNELWSIFDARRVKQPELRGLDSTINSFVGFFKNRRPMLSKLRAQAERVLALEPEIRNLGATRFAEEVASLRDLARVGKLKDAAQDRALAVAREAAWRAIGKRPFDVQIMGALAMIGGAVAEMATGEGKTITASLAASIWAWHGRPVHIITVNDYLVQRDAELMGPIYRMLGLDAGFVIHESESNERIEHYRRPVVYVTSKELVADFLRDQIQMTAFGAQPNPLTRDLPRGSWGGVDNLGSMRTAAGTAAALMSTVMPRMPLMLPGLFRVLVDEADSLLIDEAVTPLIISNSPDDEANAKLYAAANELAAKLEVAKDFKIDWTVRHCELNQRGQDHLDELAEQMHSGFWKGKRRREELVTQALTARHCYVRDEQYLVGEDGKVQIIDEFTGRIMADRSWRHGLHQAIEVKEGVNVTSDKENLARLSFQRFFRQYPAMAGMTGTAWEAAGEIWEIYQRPVIRIPTNKPCIREHLPTRFFDTMDEKWEAAVQRVCELNDKGVPILIGTRSVLASQEVSRRLSAANRPHRVLNATQTAQEASIVAEAGQMGKITVATNMAGRGTDIILGRGVAELGGLHVIATEPHGSGRVDRQLFGRAARQGDPGSAQMFACAEDDLFIRHTYTALRRNWRTVGADRLIKLAQWRAESLARFNRKQVLKNDDWMDQAVPF
jgi:preprotein translocase subunit SecA